MKRTRTRTGIAWLAVMTMAVWACGGDGADEEGGDACDGLDRIESGTFELTARAGTIVHVPDGYEPNRATPVVFVFHGGGSDPEEAAEQTGFSELADEEGFLVVYPIGRELGRSVGRAWSLTTAREPTEMNESQQPMAAWLTEGLAEGNPDIVYVEEILDELATVFCVDDRRVYATGHSFGGGFSFVLGCTLSDRFAAIGPVSVWSVKGLGDCSPTRPVPIMSFFSIDDSGYEGGQWAPYVELWSFPEFAQLWSELNGCTSGPEPGDRSGGATSEVWSGCSSPVVMWTLSDGGHTWPGSTELFASADIDASEALWEFFAQHPLP